MALWIGRENYQSVPTKNSQQKGFGLFYLYFHHYMIIIISVLEKCIKNSLYTVIEQLHFYFFIKSLQWLQIRKYFKGSSDFYTVFFSAISFDHVYHVQFCHYVLIIYFYLLPKWSSSDTIRPKIIYHLYQNSIAKRIPWELQSNRTVFWISEFVIANLRSVLLSSK